MKLFVPGQILWASLVMDQMAYCGRIVLCPASGHYLRDTASSSNTVLLVVLHMALCYAVRNAVSK